MNETVVIITGAAPLHERAVAEIPHHAIVLAADAGLDHARAAGLSPAGLIGDLDSVSHDGLAWALEHSTIQRHPVDKDLTDTELAVAFAAAMDPERIVLLAGGGDRLDHTLAAIGSLGARALTGVPTVECWWGDQYVRVLHGPGRAVLDVDVGATVSLLAMHGPCTGVVISGTKWPLDGVELQPLAGLGVSNVAIEPRIELAVSLGVLSVFVTDEVTS